uniref:Uncharacterized protein n=1 Tax=Eptatretus burgeri TaxID=7764 RepID=A0A8C4Q6F5_EPTBU
MSREQRANLKFLAKLGETPSESFAMLQQVHGEETMSRTREVEDYPRSGRPSTIRRADNIERVKQMVRADRRLTVRMIAEELSINKDTVWSIITENLEMCKVCAKMVPKLLSEDQKQRVTVCQDIIERLEDDPDLLRRVITSDESWIFEYDPETKQQKQRLQAVMNSSGVSTSLRELQRICSCL